jgi:acetamidase/formamidase
MSWLPSSVMYRRGVAHGEVGQTYELTEERQGKFQFTMGPYSEPAITIHPGDRIVTETLDAFGGLIKTEKDSPSEKPTKRADPGRRRREG